MAKNKLPTQPFVPTREYAPAKDLPDVGIFSYTPVLDPPVHNEETTTMMMKYSTLLAAGLLLALSLIHI